MVDHSARHLDCQRLDHPNAQRPAGEQEKLHPHRNRARLHREGKTAGGSRLDGRSVLIFGYLIFGHCQLVRALDNPLLCSSVVLKSVDNLERLEF